MSLPYASQPEMQQARDTPDDIPLPEAKLRLIGFVLAAIAVAGALYLAFALAS